MHPFLSNGTPTAIDAAICASLDCEAAPPSEADTGRQLACCPVPTLNYALTHPRLWAAVFNHSLPPGQSVPDQYRATMPISRM